MNLLLLMFVKALFMFTAVVFIGYGGPPKMERWFWYILAFIFIMLAFWFH